MVRSRLVSVVDDDESVREALPDLLRSFGFEVEPYASAEAFLVARAAERTGCLVLDVAMPGMSGPELQVELARHNSGVPIVFITSHIDDKLKQRVMGAGAVACLFKPFSENAIVEAVNAALAQA